MWGVSSSPLVTVILPTFNRRAFLEEAFASIVAQSFQGWDLVVVDDGSTDGTRALVEAFARSQPGRVRYVYQPNGGAYSARNRGLDHATGRYIAFFDSDDLWLPHHLERSVRALEAHADVDWVFGACRLVNHVDGRTIGESTFHPDGRPRPFLDLRTRRDGDLRIIDDRRALECQLTYGLYCGLQNSVIRRTVFQDRRFNERSKVVDDELFVIRVLSAGATLAYFDDPHVVYRVHDDNSSGSASGMSAARHLAIFQETTEGLEQLRSDLTLTARERRAFARRLGREYFWHVGYLGLWQAGREREALAMFRRGLTVWPWQIAGWKTYLGALFKVRLRRVPV
jgi:glycosyltransferase involved in cell wall biosynthesis